MKTFEECEKYIYDLSMFGIKLGLEQTQELFDSVLKDYDYSLKYIHLAGTNGKGSTGAMLSATLSGVGFKVGLYTSPHLKKINERFKINDEEISDKNFVEIVNIIFPYIEKMKKAGHCPTYFEVVTVLAALHFYKEKVDFVIWETGMGGRFDATNIITPICSIITGISLDHQSYLGNTIEKIAYEKAGIIKKNISIFCADMHKDALVVIKKEAFAKCADLKLANSYELTNEEIIIEDNSYYQKFSINGFDIKLSLNGKYQLLNAKLVFMVLEKLSKDYNFSLKKALLNLSKVAWKGRFQILENGDVIDGAHNIEAMQLLVKSLKEYFPSKKFTVVFANYADKDTADILKEVAQIAKNFIFTSINNTRTSCTPQELVDLLKKVSNVPAQIANSIDDIQDFNYKENFLWTGSLYLVGEIC